MHHRVHLAHIIKHRRRLHEVDMVVQRAREAVRCRAHYKFIRALVLVRVVLCREHLLHFGEWETDGQPIAGRVARHVRRGVHTM